MQKSLNITKGCFPYWNKIHIIISGKEVDCDGQGEDMEYWLNIEPVL